MPVGARAFSIFGEVALQDGASPALAKLGLAAERFGQRFESAIDGAGERFERFSKRVENNAERFESAGKRIAAVGAAVQVGLGAAVLAGANFDTQMRTVRGITRATDEDFEKLVATARQLGATTSFTAQQAGEGFELLARAGFSVRESIETLPGVLRLAEAEGIGLGEAANITAQAIRGFGERTGESGRIVDTFHNAASNANTNVLQLSEAFKFVAPSARGFGIAIEDTSAAVGLLSDTGIQAGEAGTGLARVLTRGLNPAGKDAENAVRRLGLQLRDANGRFVGLEALVAQLSAAYERFGETTEFVDLAHAAFGDRGFRTAVNLGTAGVEAYRDLREEIGRVGTAAETADEKMSGLGGTLLRMRSAIGELSIAITRSGLDDTLQSIGETFTRWTIGLSQLNPAVLKWGSILAAAVLPLGGFVTALPLIVKLLPLFASGLGLVLSPLGLVVGAIVALVGIRVADWLDAAAERAELLGNALDRIRNSTDPFATRIEEATELLETQRERLAGLEAQIAHFERAAAYGAGGGQLAAARDEYNALVRAISDTEGQLFRLRDAQRAASETAAEGTGAIESLGDGITSVGDALAETGERLERFSLDRYLAYIRRIERQTAEGVERIRAALAERVAGAPAPDFDTAAGRPDIVPGIGPEGGPPALGTTRAEREAADLLGVTPLSVLRERAEQARAAYETIARSGEFSGQQVRMAYEEAMAAQRELRRAAGSGRAGPFAGLLESLGEFAARSGGAIDGLVSSGIDRLFGRDGLFGGTWEERLRAIGEDFARQFAPSLLRTLGGLAARGAQALAGLVGGRGRRGALQLVSDQAGEALGGVGRLFGGVEDAAAGTDRQLSSLAAGLRAFGGGPAGGVGAVATGSIVNAIVKAFGTLGEALAAIGEFFWRGILEVWDGFLRPVGEALWKGLAAAWRYFLEPAAGLFWDGVKGLWNRFLSPAAGLFWDGVKALWREFLKPALGTLWDAVKGFVLPFWRKFLLPVGTALWDLAKGFVLPLWNRFLKPVLGTLWDLVKAVVVPFWEHFLRPILGTIWDILSPVLTPIWENFLKPVGGTIWDLVKGAVLKLWRAFFGPPATGLVIDQLGPDLTPDLGGRRPGGSAPDSPGGGGGGGLLNAITGVITAASSVIGNFQAHGRGLDLEEIARQTNIISRALIGFNPDRPRGSVDEHGVVNEPTVQTHGFEVLGQRLEAAWEDTIHGSLRQIAVVLSEMGPRVAALLGTVRPWFEAQANENVTQTLVEAFAPAGHIAEAMAMEREAAAEFRATLAGNLGVTNSTLERIAGHAAEIAAKDFSPRIVVSAPSPARSFGLDARERASREIAGDVADALAGG